MKKLGKLGKKIRDPKRFIPTIEPIQEPVVEGIAPEDLEQITIKTRHSGDIDVDIDKSTAYMYKRGEFNSGKTLGIYEYFTGSAYLWGEGGEDEYDDDYIDFGGEDFEDIMNKQPREYVSRAAEIDKAIEELNADFEKAEDPAEKKKIAKLLKKLIANVESATEIDRTNKAKIDAYNAELEEEQQNALAKRKKLLKKLRLKIVAEREEQIKKTNERKQQEKAEQEAKRQRDLIEPADIIKRRIQFNLTPDWRLSNEDKIKNLQEIVEDYESYKTEVKKIPSYPKEVYNAFKADVIKTFGNLKREVINSIYEKIEAYINENDEKRVAELKTLLETFTKEEIIQAIGDDKKEEILKKVKKLDKVTDKLIKEYDKLKEEGGDKAEIKKLAKKYNEEMKKLNNLKDLQTAYFGIKGTGIVDNPELYEKAKAYADNIYKKPSAFKSGFIVKKYKEMGGTYSGEKPETTGIARWFKEEKTGGKVVALGVQAEKIPKGDDIWKWSNPVKVAEMAKKYLGDMAVVFRSTKPKKKYMIFDPDNKKWVFFGEINFSDFTQHQDPKRRENYLRRTANMKGDWKDNKYSANMLSRNILWNA